MADGGTLERRHAARYRLRAAVDFHWGASEGAGWTRDISVNGAYVACPIVPPLEKTIDIEIRFSRTSNVYSGLRMHSKGLVVRVDKGLNSGFAVTAKLNRLARRSPGKT